MSGLLAVPAPCNRASRVRLVALLAAVVLLTISACSSEPVPRSTADDMNVFAPPSPWLKQLFAQSDQAMLQRNPLVGLYRGDLRYTNDFGEYLSVGHYAQEHAAAEHDLAVLDSIKRSSLNASDQISYDTFRWQRAMDLSGYQPEILQAVLALPLDHFNGLHVQFVDVSSGRGVARFESLKDYEDGLERLHGFARELDTARVQFAKGLDAGIVHSKVVTRNLLDQLDGLIKQGVDSSPLYAPIRALPAAFTTADQTRLTEAYRNVIGLEVLPGYTALHAFLKDSYLSKSRDSVGLSSMKFGSALYRHLIAVNTTTTLTPDSIHALGLTEVARIEAAMDSVRQQVAFTGTLKEFFEHLRKDPQFQPATADTLRLMYEAVGRKVEARVRDLFASAPKAPLEIRAVPGYLEQSQAAGYYNQGTPDGSRPGVFYYNTYDLPSRSTTGIETLYLHEAVPGHHFQISLAQETASLPNFQRFGGNNAYVEGWALYAESLGFRLGLFTNPYQYFGSLNDEMLRAMRLVVDTGLHEKGWTRDQAIAYMLAHSSMGRTDAESEVDRYIAMPAQALSYKIGQLTIQRLRDKAEEALGPKFDIREFHSQVLGSGALPMEVLEAKIDRWIITSK